MKLFLQVSILFLFSCQKERLNERQIIGKWKVVEQSGSYQYSYESDWFNSITQNSWNSSEDGLYREYTRSEDFGSYGVNGVDSLVFDFGALEIIFGVNEAFKMLKYHDSNTQEIVYSRVGKWYPFKKLESSNQILISTEKVTFGIEMSEFSELDNIKSYTLIEQSKNSLHLKTSNLEQKEDNNGKVTLNQTSQLKLEKIQ